MVIGENAKSGDMDVNPVRAKQASNIRTVNKDEKVYLPPAKRMNVEELIGYMNDDEIIEVTPKSVRLRKAELESGARQRAARSKKKQQDALKQKKK
jgi:GTP-binding protein